MTSRDENAYTGAVHAMVVDFGVLFSAGGHLPLVLGSIVGADWKVCNFDCGIGVLLEKLAYTAHDFTDVRVVLSLSFMP